MLKEWISLFKNENLWLSGDADANVENITADSRIFADDKLRTLKTVFFARRGAAKDGHEFLNSLASSPSIVAFVVESIPANFKTKIPVIVVRDSTAAMAVAAKTFYKDPTHEALTVAVTGTNGKTTTTFLVQSLLKVLGRRPVRMGTIETEFENKRIESQLTTPDFTEIQKSFSNFRNLGANAFIFEASSHALDQRRLLGIEVDAAIFTNLTPEHLDYHRTMEKYFEAKKKLFSDLLLHNQKKTKIVVLPLDGSYGSRLVEELQGINDLQCMTWTLDKAKALPQSLIVENFKTSLKGSEIEVSGSGLSKQVFHSRLVGEYNVENIMGMIALGVALKADAKTLQKALDEVPAIPGRLEPVELKSKAAVFVDYAHTPDALENVLMTLRPLTKGKLKVVFGCGGDRDRLKRPQMGAIAELYADELFVTSDNPRTEDPESILQQILQGLQRLKPVNVEVDRRKAIELSLKNLQDGDVVLIAGKGHENYQILGQKKIHFDDREVALECFSN
ncbi:MAG: UDP-N-acetylmuramoyl-L-alanyl-D-glutamate--2,6-diaminopimelate ligase [Deltaproteobacteria bacterium]|nr:UDP-N-acetylmuramoyl-L-alanyl-D-glutamate--2,6-diaminopimelate ligase [Deltaproteobacteria bacterium]